MDEFNPLGTTPGDGASPAPTDYTTGDEYTPVEEALPVEEPAEEPAIEPPIEPVNAPEDLPVDEQAVEPITEPVNEPINEPAAPPAEAPAAMPQAQPYAPPYTQAPYQPRPPYQQPQYSRPPYAQAQPYPQQPYQQQYQQPPYTQAPPYPQQPYYPPQPPQPGAPVQPRPVYGQPQNPQNPYPAQNPYAAPPQAAPVYPPNGQPYAPAAPAQKPRTSTATKVFIIVLCSVLVALIAGFIAYVSGLAKEQNKSNESGVFFPGENYYDDFFGEGENGKNNNSASPRSLDTFEEEITLVEDKGETQVHPDDLEASVGKPDEKAKGITLSALPKDADDAKYTAQSAYESVCDSVVTVILYEKEITENVYDIVGQGTGTIISADGYIVTNSHVIGNSKLYAIKITTNSGETYQAKVIGYDTWADLAVLKIDATGLKPVTFGDSDLIGIGEDVIAIGSPGGERFQNSLTKGIVSAVDRELTINKYVRYIQSDAAISPGNSGGPLCNIYGQVIGINTAKTTATNYEAMTFSIPSRAVKASVDDLIHYGYIRGRARIGFSGTEVSSEEQTYSGLPAGVLVGEIDETGSLAGTKIKSNDIITAVDGTPVESFQDIYAILSEHKAGDKVTLSITRVKDE